MTGKKRKKKSNVKDGEGVGVGRPSFHRSLAGTREVRVTDGLRAAGGTNQPGGIIGEAHQLQSAFPVGGKNGKSDAAGGFET